MEKFVMILAVSILTVVVPLRAAEAIFSDYPEVIEETEVHTP